LIEGEVAKARKHKLQDIKGNACRKQNNNMIIILNRNSISG
jgi:hypothetical protein